MAKKSEKKNEEEKRKGKTNKKEREIKWEIKRGRPQKFDPDLAIQIIEEEIVDYLKNRKKEGRYWEMLPTNDNGGVALKGKPFTTVGTIALMCGVDIDTFLLHVNAKNEDGSLKNEQLFGSYKRFKNLAQLKLIEGGASGAYSSNFVAFVGNVNYGMIPKQQVEQSVEIKSMDKIYADLNQLHQQEVDRLEQQRQETMKRKLELDTMDMEE